TVLRAVLRLLSRPFQLRYRLSPLAKPARRLGRLLGSAFQFASQTHQVISYIDVVAMFRESGGECKRLGLRQQSLQCGFCSHAGALEQRRVHPLGPHQVIAAIVRGSDDHVMRLEHVERMTWSSDPRTMAAITWWGPRGCTRRCSRAPAWEQKPHWSDCWRRPRRLHSPPDSRNIATTSM